MYEYAIYSYIGILVVVVFKGYYQFYKFNNNDNNENIKYSLFDDSEVNDLNKLLLGEQENININTNSETKTILRIKLHNFKKQMNEKIDKMFSSIKSIYKQKYEPINSNKETELLKPKYGIELRTPNYMQNIDNSYDENVSYVEGDLSSTLNSEDLNLTINEFNNEGYDSNDYDNINYHNNENHNHNINYYNNQNIYE